MKFEEFEKIMLSEWCKSVLAQVDCETPEFDKLYVLKEKLYDFFYPLGISGSDMHSVSAVWRDLYYAWQDDGDLSIIVAYTDLSDADIESQTTIMKKIRPDYIRKPRTDDDWFIDVFVVNRDAYLIDEEYIKSIALRSSNRKFVKFVAKQFTSKVFDFIYGLNNRFITANELARKTGIASTKEYYSYTKETDKMLADFILSLEY